MSSAQPKKRSAQAGRNNGGTSITNGATRATRRNPLPTPANETETVESDEPVELTPDEVMRAAVLAQENGENFDYETPGTSLVTPAGASAAARPTSNAADARLRTGLAGVDDSVVETETNATEEDCGFIRAQVNEAEAMTKSINLTKFVKMRVFPILKFVSGKKTLEYGRWASGFILDWLQIQGQEARTRKWEEIKKVVNESLNTRRSDCTSHMKRKYIGKYVDSILKGNI